MKLVYKRNIFIESYSRTCLKKGVIHLRLSLNGAGPWLKPLSKFTFWTCFQQMFSHHLTYSTFILIAYWANGNSFYYILWWIWKFLLIHNRVGNLSASLPDNTTCTVQGPNHDYDVERHNTTGQKKRETQKVWKMKKTIGSYIKRVKRKHSWVSCLWKLCDCSIQYTKEILIYAITIKKKKWKNVFIIITNILS